MAQSLLQIRDLVVLDTESSDQAKVIPTITVFLLSVISTAADLVEMTVPGGSTYLYAEVEAGVKNGGIRSIVKAMGENSPHYYSVSGIESDDIEAAMSYVGQELAVTLTKALHELPMPLRTSETQLRGIETLITNLLCQRFTNPHEVLDNLVKANSRFQNLRREILNRNFDLDQPLSGAGLFVANKSKSEPTNKLSTNEKAVCGLEFWYRIRIKGPEEELINPGPVPPVRPMPDSISGAKLGNTGN